MKRWGKLILVALLMMSLLAACGGGGEAEVVEDDTPAAVQEDSGKATAEATTDGSESETQEANEDSEEPVVEDEGEAGDLTLDENPLGGLNSYRSKMHWKLENEDGSVEEIAMEQEATRDPVAHRLVMESEGEEIETVQIGDQQWLRFGEEWMQTTLDEEAMAQFDEFFMTPDDLQDAINDNATKFVGKEKVNGVNTRHYRIEYNAFLGKLGMGDDGEIEEGVADVWIADESGLPKFAVRFIMDVKGIVDEESGTSGNLTLEQDFYDLNANITIEAPEVEAGVISDLPVYPDATEVTSMGGMMVYSASDDVETVGAFYVDELTAAGWTQSETMDMEGMIMDTWTKDGDSLQVIITAKGDGTTGVDVTLLLEEAGTTGTE